MTLTPTPPKNLAIELTISADDMKPSTRTYRNPLDVTIESHIARRVVDIVTVNDTEQKTTEAHTTTTTITITEEHYSTRPTATMDHYYATTQEDLP